MAILHGKERISRGPIAKHGPTTMSPAEGWVTFNVNQNSKAGPPNRKTSESSGPNPWAPEVFTHVYMPLAVQCTHHAPAIGHWLSIRIGMNRSYTKSNMNRHEISKSVETCRNIIQ